MSTIEDTLFQKYLENKSHKPFYAYILWLTCKAISTCKACPELLAAAEQLIFRQTGFSFKFRSGGTSSTSLQVEQFRQLGQLGVNILTLCELVSPTVAAVLNVLLIPANCTSIVNIAKSFRHPATGSSSVGTQTEMYGLPNVVVTRTVTQTETTEVVRVTKTTTVSETVMFEDGYVEEVNIEHPAQQPVEQSSPAGAQHWLSGYLTFPGSRNAVQPANAVEANTIPTSDLHPTDFTDPTDVTMTPPDVTMTPPDVTMTTGDRYWYDRMLSLPRGMWQNVLNPSIYLRYLRIASTRVTVHPTSEPTNTQTNTQTNRHPAPTGASSEHIANSFCDEGASVTVTAAVHDAAVHDAAVHDAEVHDGGIAPAVQEAITVGETSWFRRFPRFRLFSKVNPIDPDDQ